MTSQDALLQMGEAFVRRVASTGLDKRLCAALLISTEASARCDERARFENCFKQFSKPSKRLTPPSHRLHRAEASVLMRRCNECAAQCSDQNQPARADWDCR
jgi:hypothetical protein